MIQNLSDNELHYTILTLRKNEKSTVISLIEHLEEVRRRKLFSDFGCSSIHTYCVKILDYSDGEAWARVKALDLIEDMPKLKESLDHRLSLTNAAYLQQLFEVANYSQDKKEFLIEKAMDKSTREVKAILDQQAIDDHLKKDIDLKNKRKKIKSSTKITFTLTEEEMEDLDFIKSKLNISSDIELLKYLLKEKREKLDPALKEVKVIKPSKTSSKPRSISPFKKFQVYKKAGSKCENCGSVFNLNIDHVRPVGLDGTNDLSGLRLLCRACNLRAAIKIFGVDKMNNFGAKPKVYPINERERPT